jgi:hypothetical protein
MPPSARRPASCALVTLALAMPIPAVEPVVQGEKTIAAILKAATKAKASFGDYAEPASR